MANSRERRPETVTRCMRCGDELVIIGDHREPEILCHRSTCKKNGVSTPIRPIGFVRVPDGMIPKYGLSILEAIQSGRVPANVLDQYLDPLYDYRQIKGLIVIGPAELDRACRSLNPDNPNPLELKDGWVPNIPVPERTDKWIKSLIWRDDEKWKTRAALVITPPIIGKISTNLIGQNKIWGVPHDGLPGGLVRDDVFWANYFVEPNYDWANELAVTEWQWVIIYEHLLWVASSNWENQQKAANKKGMLISTASQDTFVLNVVLAATGIKLRADTISRTSTLHNGHPLVVSSISDGVNVNQCWIPSGANDNVSASVQGVPLDFDP